MDRFVRFAVLMVVSLALCAGASAAVDLSGVAALARRLSPDLASSVAFVVDEDLAKDGKDAAKIVPPKAGGKTFTIRAGSARAASLALGVYVRDVAKGDVSWSGTRLPKTWPLPKETIDVRPHEPLAVAYNYCTLSYTMAYWGFSEWQHEIDRLALQGYNVALLTAGLQKVWDLTLADMGYSAEQRRAFIADDAASAWWLMGNLEGLGGPVSQKQIDLDAALGARLVKAMRAVGIEPLFQGYVGLIPSTTTDAERRGAQVFDMGSWCGFKSPDVIDPTSATFAAFAKSWYRNLVRVYKLTRETAPKYLGGDLFHENAPPKALVEAGLVTTCAEKVQATQQRAFPGVTWVIQSWNGSPVQALQDGLDPAHTVIEQLDQTMGNSGATRRGTYKNQTTGAYLPWIWVEVLNFGGNTGMHGAFRRFANMDHLLDGLDEGRREAFRGYGLLSEGLETNPSSYALFANAFAESGGAASRNVEDMDAFLAAWRPRRYGLKADIPELAEAHAICARTVWDCARDQQGTIESVFCAYPSYTVESVSTWGPRSGTPYARGELIGAAKLFLKAAKAHPELFKTHTFRYDFVEIFQQILADKAREMLPDCADDPKSRARFRELLKLADAILACSAEWRLDAKEARLRKVAKGDRKEDAIAAYRRMITTWTPVSRGRTELGEYAHRSYAGLMEHYYAKRWESFFAVADGKKSDADHRDFLAELDRSFPAAKLPATPKNYNPLKLAARIVKLVDDAKAGAGPKAAAQSEDGVAKVTLEAGATNGSPGTVYRTLAEATAAYKKLRPKHKSIRLWLIDESLDAPKGWEKKSSPYGAEIVPLR